MARTAEKPMLHEQEFIGPWCVSTVELSTEHHGGMWFETYIFEADGEQITNWLESWGIRYRTAAEATRGHDRITALVRAGIPLDDLDAALEEHNTGTSQSERAIPSDASAERSGDMGPTTDAAQRLSRSDPSTGKEPQ